MVVNQLYCHFIYYSFILKSRLLISTLNIDLSKFYMTKVGNLKCFTLNECVRFQTVIHFDESEPIKIVIQNISQTRTVNLFSIFELS